jgi:uncharacterized protein YaiL (DUF2058 family)
MSLRDQFKKANLISSKDAKRLAHEARVERKEKGREQLEQEEQQRQQALQAASGAERARIQREQRDLDAARAERDEAAAVAAILADEAHRAGPGTVRFYFATADGSLPWLEVSPREAQELRAGQLCVVLAGPEGVHDYRLLPLELAKRVARLRPDVIVHAPRGVVAGR